MRVYAERLLARREYAVLELQARLVKKWSGKWSGKWPGLEQIEERVAQLISVLQADGVLSDERFAESFIRSRRRRCHGPIKIQAELRQRQVPEAVIAGKLEQAEDDWTALAAAWLSRQCPGPLDFAGRAKYYRRLMHRGFSHQQAMGALAAHSES
jgi:regulatory protein